jgi:hypothetical protein
VVRYRTLTTTKKENNMIPFVAAGRVGVSMLKYLYKGKKKLGKGMEWGAKKAEQAKWTKTSQAISGVSKKGHEYSRKFGKTVKKYPKTSAAVTGAVAWDILDKD